MSRFAVGFGFALLLVLAPAPLLRAQPAPAAKSAAEALPPRFDLRETGGLTPIKAQQGGTCWTHGTMAAIESNLLLSGAWKKLGRNDEPALSEYHLDWWNGFNKHCNLDLDNPTKNESGLKVHMGGDYRVAAAYISRGDGVVVIPPGDDGRPDPRAWFAKAPDKLKPGYQRLYVRDIEWFVLGPQLEGIDVIKRRVMTEGALGTAMAVSKAYMSRDNVHYQPFTSKLAPNHAVAIVGWDDTKLAHDKGRRGVPQPGAWLIKNSWGRKRGDHGYYWISYYDKVCCRDEEMGAVSFRNVVPLTYDRIYYHDYHGWRATLKDIDRAFNAYTARGDDWVKAVSFYTATNNVAYTAKIFRRFEKGQLTDPVAVKTGVIAVKGFHTVDLPTPVKLAAKDKFYVYLELSNGGQAIDRTSEIPVLLGPDLTLPSSLGKGLFAPNAYGLELLHRLDRDAKPKPGMGPNGPLVISRANPGESYYWNGSEWKDLYNFEFDNPNWATFDRSANFCMKALTVAAPQK